MRADARLALQTLVVFNHSLDAAMFRVVAIDPNNRLRVTVVDASLANPAGQVVDKGMILMPSVGQLKAHNAKPEPKSLLTGAQRAAAEQLLAERPEVLPGTRVCIDRFANSRWFQDVTAKMNELKLKGKQVGEFCDIAGVPD
jgi:hypothetical protein